ncbi:MAG: hypothetical protein PHY57_07225 [Ignavibacterium sp.]|nr:hypothetical protein [Ignavibacterium sp.]MDX9711188.1 hypothetical protein [Ignavibacteriaceae bacterium]GIK20834.1 MAG: hypothetical protein BroJett005_02480 [Ignavibacteriota bacterium]
MTDQMKKSTSNFWVITLMICVAAFVRLLPHPPNFAPIAAMALFGGAYFNRKAFAFAIPLFAILLTDAIIGFYPFAFIVYVSLAVIVLLGIVMLKKVSVKNVVLASVTASVSFFVITNFGVWMLGTLYPKTPAGLMESYIAAIPFFQNSLIGDLFFSGVMFGVYELVKHKVPALHKVKA